MCLKKNLLTILLLIGILTACSVKKNTWVSRNYHSLTAYYNVYFNGNQAFLDGQKEIWKSTKNDYTTLLPIYPESDKSIARVADGNMSTSIEKGEKIIEKHSITVKPKRKGGKTTAKQKEFARKTEFNPMVDDGYLLMGKAHVIRHENLEAVNVLEHLSREFEGTKERYEGLIWLSRAYVQMEQYVNAQATLESYDMGGKAPEILYAQYMAAYANLLLAQAKYDEAIPYLEKAASNTTKKEIRLRYKYILAQLYRETGRNSEAAKAFSEVVKNNPDYEMSFNARIQSASVVSGASNFAETEKALNKLSRDKKNKEYQDQIYYALGRLKLNMNNEKEAVQHFRTSIEKSSTNEKQKGLSFMALGDLYYQKPTYTDAYAAYDSAVILVSDQHPKFTELNERHENLKELSAHLMAVQTQDSLLKLARMTEEERMAVIDKILERQKKELEKKQQATQGSFYDPFFNDPYGREQSQQTAQQGGKWYFYNPTSLAAGRMEFERRWGKRKNEDNWRRSTKASSQPDDFYSEPGGLPELPEEGSAQNTKPTIPTEKESNTSKPEATQTKELLLANIPINPDAQQKSHKTIEESLYESGTLINDRVHDHKTAAQCFERLLKEYPKTKNRETALVGAYQAYQKNDKQQDAARIKEMIIAEYPESRFALFLTDPQFFEKLEQKRMAMEQHYESTYSLYLKNDFAEVLNQCRLAPEGNNNIYQPKYKLIGALSHAKLGDSEPFKTGLETIVKDYPQSEESVLASTLLKEIEKGRLPIKATEYQSQMTAKTGGRLQTDENSTSLIPTFIYSPYEGHQALIIVNAATNMQQLQYNLADFNFGRYLVADYDAEIQQLPDQTPVMMVKGLKNKMEAMDYLYTIQNQNKIFADAGLNEPTIMVVSDNNVSNLLMSGSTTEYQSFFNGYYLTVVKEPERKATTEAPKQSVKNNKEEQESKSSKETEATAQTEKVEQPTELPTAEPKGPFVIDESPVSVMILIKKGRVDLKKAQTLIVNITSQNYGEEIRGEKTELGTTHVVIKASGFDNEKAAQGYIDRLTESKHLIQSLVGDGHYVFVISETNYEALMKNKDIKGYQQFIESQKQK